MDEKADHVLLLAIAVGLAGGTAAAVASLAFPHAVGIARTIIQAKRKKEQRELRNRTKIDKAKKGSKKSKESGVHTNVLRQLLVKWKDIDVTVEKFPYFLSENTKTALLDSMYIFLKCPEYGKYVTNLPSVSPRILLTGPPGSELYQEQLVKSLAHHLQVNILVLDLVNTILEVKESQSGGVEKAGGESQASCSNAQNSMLSANGLDKKAANDTDELSKSSSTRRCTVISQGNIYAENRIPDRNCVGLGLVSESFPTEKTSIEGGVEGKQSDLEVAMPATVSATVIESSKRMPKKGDRVRYVGPGNTASTSSHRSSTGVKGPITGSKGKILLVLEENPSKVGVKFDKPIYGGNNLVDLCEDGHGYFCNVSDLRLEHLNGEDVEKLVLESLIDLLTSEASKEPIILFVKEAEKSAFAYLELYKKLEQLEKTEAKVVVVGSHTVEFQKDKGYANSAAASSNYKSTSNLNALLDLSLLDNIMSRFDDMKGEPHKGHRILAKLFPTRIYLQQPQDEAVSSVLNRQLTQDAEQLKAEANRKQIRQVMGASNIMCNDLSKVEIVTHTVTQDMSEKIVGWAVSHHLQRTSEPEIIKGKLLIKGESLQHSFEELLSVLRQQTAKKKHLKDVVCENEFEKMLLAEVIPPDELRVTFDDIGALDNVKEALRELVMLPLQRPELFSKGQLRKPCKGLLLFGPPGTGKTMLAKAVATESGAFFINLSLATIASKWFGEAEKFVKAVFTLASKIEPCVIFIDEVDSMLARRGRDFDSSAMRKLKNEFMSSWDGLRTREKERVLVLAATNRPFDLDEAVIRRFPRRLMVDLPDKVNRKKILEVILADEEVDPDVDLTELASTTDGYSGSDLKNLCITAAYERIREILNQEKQAKEKAKREGVQPPPIDPMPCLRPLNMSDLKQAMGKVRASVATSSITTMELQQWNDQYGEGGTRKQQTLTYFL